MYLGYPARECDYCGEPLYGRQRRWCSARCRVAYAREEQAAKKNAGKDRRCRICGGRLLPTNPRPVCRPWEDTFEGDECFELQVTKQREAHAAQIAARRKRLEAVCPCGKAAGWDGMGRARKYCSNACRQRAYRERKRAQLRGHAE